jgi:formylglycine-generating enzyme required for sulfatase activity
VHEVEIVNDFALGQFEVTFAEWEVCVAAKECSDRLRDEGWGRKDRPVINASWEHAKEYLRWLSKRTGMAYRLPSEAEWEYAARAGTQTAYWWGDKIGRKHATCLGCGSRWDMRKTTPVGGFPANAFGLHEMLGNAAEWVEDCWNDDYSGAPTDGSAWTQGDCSQRVLRGGSWVSMASVLRSAARSKFRVSHRDVYTGFRVARSLP